MSAAASVREVGRASAAVLSEVYELLAQWGRESRPSDPSETSEPTVAPTTAGSESSRS